MRNNKKTVLVIVSIVVAGIAVFAYQKIRRGRSEAQAFKEISPVYGTIQNVISTTGTVLPKNRLEVKPPVNGRIDEILVKEGEKVKAGQTLAWMSSTERAALLDAARGGGEEKLAYWKEVYKPIPLIAPIEAEVIVSTMQPGQTVTTSDAVVVLSDLLIVRAQVDETDIGKIRLGQTAVVTLDAYPDTAIKGTVEHLYYESKTVNNVTMYEVDLRPAESPSFFRSGMNATVAFEEETRGNILLLPQEAVQRDKDSAWVWVKDDDGKPTKRTVTAGLSDEKRVEIASGLTDTDTVMVKSTKYALPTQKEGSNPFMPARPKR